MYRDRATGKTVTKEEFVDSRKGVKAKAKEEKVGSVISMDLFLAAQGMLQEWFIALRVRSAQRPLLWLGIKSANPCGYALCCHLPGPG